MDFIDKIRELSARIPKQLEHIHTEEATKSALVMPFIAALGYNVFDPTEVTPELNADVGLKKGEKVDYAIMQNGQPIMLFECKHHTADLSLQHASQLYRYFSVTAARFAVLTNGIFYRFYTDLDAPNKMDAKPFFEFDLLNLDERAVEELKKFSKSTFDVDNILNTATELRYTREIKQILGQQIQDPAPEFVRFFTSRVYEGRMRPQVKEQFEEIARRAFRQFINDQVNERLKSALGQGAPTLAVEQATPQEAQSAPETEEGKARTPETTEEELEAYYIIKAILREAVEPKRVIMRDAQSYCAILLDNNNRRPICRLRFNNPKRRVLGLFNEQKQEDSVPLQSMDDIYQYADRLKAAVAAYTSQGT